MLLLLLLHNYKKGLNMYLKTKTVNEIKELIYKENLNKKLHILDYETLIRLKDEDIIKLTKQNIEYLIGNSNRGLSNLHHKLLYLYGIDIGLHSYYNDILEFSMISHKVYKTLLDTNDKELGKVLEVLQVHSNNSCLVGGSVRDILLDKKPKDFDFVTDGTYNDLKNAFLEEGFEIKETGKQFLVLKVYKNNKEFEIALYRKDGTYTNGRHPDNVEIGDIFSDAQRRDFTINSLYYNLNDMKLLDPTAKGIEDLLNKTLRFNGKPKHRIKEDYLRVFRFYRFLDKLSFKPDSKSIKAVRTLFNEAIKNTDGERVRNEIERIVFK